MSRAVQMATECTKWRPAEQERTRSTSASTTIPDSPIPPQDTVGDSQPLLANCDLCAEAVSVLGVSGRRPQVRQMLAPESIEGQHRQFPEVF